MSLAERLNEDMKEALRQKDKTKLSVIRMVRSAVKNAEIDRQKTLTDDEIVEVLSRELKQRRDSLQEFEKAKRQDLVESVKEEIEILTQYLPEPLSEEELRRVIKETIHEIGAVSKRDIGKVMGVLMPKVKGKTDGKQVNQIVQEELQGE